MSEHIVSHAWFVHAFAYGGPSGHEEGIIQQTPSVPAPHWLSSPMVRLHLCFAEHGFALLHAFAVAPGQGPEESTGVPFSMAVSAFQ